MNRSLWAAGLRGLARLRPWREPLSLALDTTMVWLCWQLTYLFRLGFERWFSARPAEDLQLSLAVAAFYGVVFCFMQVQRSLWRFVGFGDVQRLLLACALAATLAAGLVAGLLGVAGVPRSVLALHPAVTVLGVCAMRVAYRMLVEHMMARAQGPRVERPALVLGAGEAARRLVAGIQGQGWRVLGLLDDDPHKAGARVAGVPVWGPVSQVKQQAERLGATHLIVAMPSLRGEGRRRVVELAALTGLPVLSVPSAEELQRGSSARLRDIDVDDLLGREPVRLDEAGMASALAHKRVLITGAGGSIGAELCLQVARFQPAQLVLLDTSEYALYRIDQQLREQHPQLEVVPVLLDVKDAPALKACLAQHQAQVVFHAAAYKHVPLVEVGNALAALRNNSLGTWNAAVAAGEAGVERFVLISTDKAVNPTNVMGATKRAAEMLMATLAPGYPHTRFMAVRFGNVLGSSGSVIPRFREQIARGGPITITHPDIIRYFMTIPEACRLVLQAAAIGHSGQVLVLDMGQPVRIVDLARSLIRLSGHSPEDIALEYTGLRPGEKLYEELLADADTTVPTEVSALRVATLPEPQEAGAVVAWLEAVRGLPNHDASVRQHLKALVPEYQPREALD